MTPEERADIAVGYYWDRAQTLNEAIVAAIRAAENDAIEECAQVARDWLSIPSNENAENPPDTLRRLKHI